jgi:hypothetical protein
MEQAQRIGTGGSDLKRLLSPGPIAAYMLDSLFAACKEGDSQLHTLNTAHENMAGLLIQKLGGHAAVHQVNKLVE